MIIGKLNSWVLAELLMRGGLIFMKKKRFIDNFFYDNYHFIDYISNDFNNKKIVLNL